MILQIGFLLLKGKEIQAKPTYSLPTVNEESNPSFSATSKSA
jgi:hypothetical protein